MPGPERRSESLRAARPLRFGAATVLPVERTVVRSSRASHGIWASAALEPYALVVSDADGIRAVALDGGSLPLQRLRERLPEVADLLAST